MYRLWAVILAVVCLVSSPAGAAVQFLTAPYGQAGINLQQGWFYHPDMGGGNHKAIDFVFGTLNQSATWQSFMVLSAHNGTATYHPGYNGGLGNYVSIATTVSGKTYETRYAHLDSSPLQDDVPVAISRGASIGMTGATGAANNVNHLHFVILEEGVPIDPYDVYSDRDDYPENGGSCGPSFLWTTCPPFCAANPAAGLRGQLYVPEFH